MCIINTLGRKDGARTRSTRSLLFYRIYERARVCVGRVFIAVVRYSGTRISARPWSRGLRLFSVDPVVVTTRCRRRLCSSRRVTRSLFVAQRSRFATHSLTVSRRAFSNRPPLGNYRKQKAIVRRTSDDDGLRDPSRSDGIRTRKQ